MFADFLKKLTGAAPDSLPDADARLALAALLVRVARADGRYEASEAARITTLLAKRYALAPPEAEALRTDAEALEAEAPDTVRFTRAIKDAVPYENRTAVIEAMWDVVLGDGTRDAGEEQVLRLVANLLGVSDQDSARARQRMQASRA